MVVESFVGKTDVYLTKEQKAWAWAARKLTEFQSLPTVTSEERQSVARLCAGTAEEILADPQKLVIVHPLWQSHELFSSQVRTELERKVKEKKDPLPHKTVTGLIKVYTHGQEASPVAQGVLAAYLNREGRIRDRVDTLHDLTLASLDLLDDSASLEKAVLIANFEDSVLTRESKFYADFLVARSTVDDDDLLRKAWIVDNISFYLLYLTSVDPRQVAGRTKRVPVNLTLMQSTLLTHMRRTEARLAAKLGGDLSRAKKEFEDQVKLISDADHGVSILPQRQIMEKKDEWPYSVIYGDWSDPLQERYKEVAGFIGSLVCRKKAEAGFNREGLVGSTFFGISLPEPGLMADVCIGGPLSPENKLIAVKHVFKDFRQVSKEVTNLADDPRQKGWLELREPWKIGDNVGVHWFREASVFDTKIHPLTVMDIIGFSPPKLPEGESLTEKLSVLKAEIIANQTRFLPRRGVKIALSPLQLQDSGYRSVVFRGLDGQMRAEINILGVNYPVKLDHVWDLDFEGKKPPAQEAILPLHFVLLHLLRPIVCETEEISDGNGSSKGRLRFLGRVSHYKVLPKGHFSLWAADNCLIEEGRKLVEEQERLQRLRQTTKPFTYVRAVPERDGLPPFKLGKPDIPGY